MRGQWAWQSAYPILLQVRLVRPARWRLPVHALHFGFGALVLLGGFAQCELASTRYTLPLMGGEACSLGRFPFHFLLGCTTLLPYKTPLLLGIVGIAAALLEFEEDSIAFSN